MVFSNSIIDIYLRFINNKRFLNQGLILCWLPEFPLHILPLINPSKLPG